MGVTGFFIGVLAWFDVRPDDIRYIVEYIVEKIGGLLNFRIVLIAPVIFFVVYGLRAIHEELTVGLTAKKSLSTGLIIAVVSKAIILVAGLTGVVLMMLKIW